MSELTGLELRKAACEALGWIITEEHRRFFLMRPEGKSLKEIGLSIDVRGLVEMMPAIESDPAVSEPMFLEWCERHGLTWVLNSQINAKRDAHLKQYSCQVWQPFIDQPTSGTIVQVTGSTPSEARAKAVVAASGKEK